MSKVLPGNLLPGIGVVLFTLLALFVSSLPTLKNTGIIRSFYVEEEKKV